MNQPPQPTADTMNSHPPGGAAAGRSPRRPAWRLPAGVSPGTWEYTEQESIASGYGDFIAQTPLVALDSRLLVESLPQASAGRRDRVIDFGCGNGRTLQRLWDHGFDVLGVDLSQPMLRAAAAGARGERFRHKRLRANLVELDGLADGIAAHGVCLFSTLGMIRGRDCRRQFLRHAARIIVPGGLLMLHVHNRNAAWRDWPSASAWLRSAGGALLGRHQWGDRTYAYRGLADMFLHTYSLRELHADLRASGWQLRRTLPLTLIGDDVLGWPRWLPGLRAGGFIALAAAPER